MDPDHANRGARCLKPIRLAVMGALLWRHLRMLAWATNASLGGASSRVLTSDARGSPEGRERECMRSGTADVEDLDRSHDPITWIRGRAFHE
jgi:hypothetical protein